MPSMKELPNGKWRARYKDPDGRGHARHFDKRAEAERWIAQAITTIGDGSWVDPHTARTLLFRDWAEEWKATRVKLRASTQERDFGYLRRYIVTAFGERPMAAADQTAGAGGPSRPATLASITHMQVQAWVAELTTRLEPATVCKAHQILDKIMLSAVNAKKLASNPCDNIELPVIELEEQRFLAPSEIARLVGAFDPRYRALVQVGCYGGLRIGELAGLKRRRIGPRAETVTVQEIATEVRGGVVWGEPKTKTGKRTVPLPPAVAAELRHHLDTYAGDELVFPAPRGGVLRATIWRQRFFHPAAEAAGLEPLTPHDMRHTAVALWIAAGGKLLEISRRAGHKSVSFTQDRYGHLFPQSEEELTGRLNAFFEPAVEPHNAKVLHLRQKTGTEGD